MPVIDEPTTLAVLATLFHAFEVALLPSPIHAFPINFLVQEPRRRAADEAELDRDPTTFDLTGELPLCLLWCTLPL